MASKIIILVITLYTKVSENYALCSSKKRFFTIQPFIMNTEHSLNHYIILKHELEYSKYNILDRRPD